MSVSSRERYFAKKNSWYKHLKIANLQLKEDKIAQNVDFEK